MLNTVRARLSQDHSTDIGSQVAAVCITSRSMHRHGSDCTKTPAPVHSKSLVCPLNVVVRRIFECLVRQVGRSFHQRIGDMLINKRHAQRLVGFFNSHFLSRLLFVDVATVAASESRKNVRGATV